MGLPIPEMKSELVDQCNKAGAAVVFVKELPGTRVHGAVQVGCRESHHSIELLIQGRGIFFGLPFFHEAGHVLLHGRR